MREEIIFQGRELVVHLSGANMRKFLASLSEARVEALTYEYRDHIGRRWSYYHPNNKLLPQCERRVRVLEKNISGAARQLGCVLNNDVIDRFLDDIDRGRLLMSKTRPVIKNHAENERR